MNKLFGGMALVALLALPLTARADLIAYDGFSGDDYTAGKPAAESSKPIDGVNGGYGWASGWTTYASQYYRPGNIYPSDPGLSYTGLTSQGYQLFWNTNGFGSNRLGRMHEAYRTVSSTPIGTDGQTVWATFLIQKSNYQGINGLRLCRGAHGTPVLSAVTQSGNGEKWQLVAGAASDTTTVAGSQTSTPQIVIVRIDYKAGNDDAYLWVGTGLNLASQPDISTANAELLGVADLSFDILRLDGGGYSDTRIDEIRLATDWKSAISAIPEPATMTLLGLGGVVALLRRKR